MSGGSGAYQEDYDMTNENGDDGWGEYEEEKESPAYYAAIDRDEPVINPASRVCSY
jgi:hypothetical protein